MTTRLIAIGNSRGIRIPKAMLEECNLKRMVELTARGRHIIISSIGSRPRKGWREAAARMSALGDDKLRISDAG